MTSKFLVVCSIPEKAVTRVHQDQLAPIAGFQLGQTQIALFDVPASWVMEGGVIMPEPGEEEAWHESKQS